MFLTGLFVVVIFATLFFQRAAAAEEICYDGWINIRCSSDEHIYVESAIFGRLNNSKCYNRTEDEQECKANIRYQLQLQFLRTNNISIPTVHPDLVNLRPNCPEKLPPSISIIHQCRRGSWNDPLEFCVNDEATFGCLKKESLVIESAILGSHNDSRCYVRKENEKSCNVDIKMALKRRFGNNTSISISMAGEFIFGLTSHCSKSLPFSLKVSYRCSKDSSNGNNNYSGNNSALSTNLLYIFIGPSLVFLLSIVSVACLLRRMQKSTTGATRDNDDFSDYPVSHLRRQQMTRCQAEYNEEYNEYNEYNEYDSQTYDDYSEVRNTGP